MLPPPSERLRFREMTAVDLDDMATLLGDPAVMQFYPAPKSREEARDWIAWNTNNYVEHGFGLWIIETRAGDFVGDCGLTWQNVNGVRKLEVGYHVGTVWQQRGLATEAAEAARDLARDQSLADELVAIIHPRNFASQRVAEKIGMRHCVDETGGGDPARRVFGMTLASS